ncbi:uncharacterized protein LOC119373390 isoform X2 [Rhipicephalus sanguineus]|uniref:uncharacterized protein LOC119373390 isoform X2 n=1 Tax=Rhipicephalus sanguineus TaxID=34632 RepID=UPI001892DDD1|nr:uncharacterized protein LOC119373390 isoform X2 [Rhipicephalus sanguineus]
MPSNRQFASQLTMTALTVASFTLLVVLHFGSASEQQPELNKCSDYGHTGEDHVSRQRRRSFKKAGIIAAPGGVGMRLREAAGGAVVASEGGALGELRRKSSAKQEVGINSFIEIANVTVKYARVSKKVEVNAVIRVNKTFGSSPALEIYVSAVDENSRSCNLSASPEELNLCDGTTRTEKKLTSEWNNECPIEAGTYNGELSFKVRPSRTAKSCLKDNPLLVTLKIRDEGTILDCVSFHVTTHR